MAKYISNRQQNLKIGIVSYTENKTVLEVTGKVGIGTTNATEALTVIGIVSATSFVGDGSGLTGVITSGVTSVEISDTAPVGPNAGDLWYNSILGRLFIYYEDVDSDQWVDAAPFNSTSASIITFPTGDYDDLSTTTIDAFNQNIGDVSYDCLTYPPNQLVSYDLGLVS